MTYFERLSQLCWALGYTLYLIQCSRDGIAYVHVKRDKVIDLQLRGPDIELSAKSIYEEIKEHPQPSDVDLDELF